MQIPDGLKSEVYLGGVSFVQKQFDWNVSLKFSRLCPLIINFIYINANPWISEVSGDGWGVLLYKDFA